MAKLLPERPVGAVSPGRARVHRLVESLPEGFLAWSPIGPDASDLSDFWLVEESTRRGLHLVVSEVSESQAAGPGLFGSVETWVAPEEVDRPRLERILSVLGPDLAGGVLYPDVPSGLLRAAVPGWVAVGREVCRPGPFLEWVRSRLGPSLEPDRLRGMRALFCPETVLMPSQVMRRNPAEVPVPRFLTWRQEEILKSHLSPPETLESAEDFGLLLVQGVAGSGKSLVLLHRALLLSRLDPQLRILVLTCNKPLQVELERRFQELSQGRGRAWIRTFHGFCLKHWSGSERPKIVEPLRRRALMDEALASLRKPLLLRRHLEEEFAWIFENGFPDESAYARHPRRGRGFRMDLELRGRIWAAAAKYRETCRAEGVADWSLLPLFLRDGLETEPPRSFDAILVDEAQFFAPVWFDCIRHFLAEGGRLFLCADPTQGFLRKGTSWKSVGLSVQGRSRRLDRSHRSTRPVMALAWKIWSCRNQETDSDQVEPNLEGMPEGPEPALFRFPDIRSEHAWVVDQVATFVEGGGEPRDVLVLHESWSGAADLLDRLSERLGVSAVCDAKDAAGAGSVRVCSLNSATGLESPVVFVAGAHGIFEREGSPDLDAEGKAQARDEATRKFYMALTRAGWRLVVTCVGGVPEEVRLAF